jgi:hypothetical protein
LCKELRGTVVCSDDLLVGSVLSDIGWRFSTNGEAVHLRKRPAIGISLLLLCLDQAYSMCSAP